MTITELYIIHYKDLCKFAYNRISNIENAKDIVSEVFSTLIHREDIDKNYLYQSVRNRCINYMKIKNRYVKIDEYDFPYEQQTHIGYFYIIKEIHRMPSKLRTILVLSLEDNLSNPEISKVINKPIQTVKNLKNNAFKILRKRIQV